MADLGQIVDNETIKIRTVNDQYHLSGGELYAVIETLLAKAVDNQTIFFVDGQLTTINPNT